MSDYRTMSETNGRVNGQRRMNKLALPWLQAVLNSPIANAEHKQHAKQGIDCIEAFDKLLCQGYVSTGYQYDDNDPRNNHDVLDNYFEDERARTGSTKADEAEAEIAFAIASRRASQAFEDVKFYFAGCDLASLLPEFITFPGDTEPTRNEYFMTLSDWIDEGIDAMRQDEADSYYGDFQD